MPSLQEQITQLESAITAQEALRPTPGNAAVEAIVAARQDKLAARRTRPQAAPLC